MLRNVFLEFEVNTIRGGRGRRHSLLIEAWLTGDGRYASGSSRATFSSTDGINLPLSQRGESARCPERRNWEWPRGTARGGRESGRLALSSPASALRPAWPWTGRCVERAVPARRDTSRERSQSRFETVGGRGQWADGAGGPRERRGERRPERARGKRARARASVEASAGRLRLYDPSCARVLTGACWRRCRFQAAGYTYGTNRLQAVL